VTSELDPARLDTLDALLERLLPGALDAGVRHYIERALEDCYGSDVDTYAEGLATLDARSVAAHRAPFVALHVDQQDEIVASLDDPFLDLVRRHLLEGMFGDPRWGGNVDRCGWRLLGYPGPRYVWHEEAQQIEVLR
jgi:Gluconate 2-dehydrogenase subunit 3